MLRIFKFENIAKKIIQWTQNTLSSTAGMPCEKVPFAFFHLQRCLHSFVNFSCYSKNRTVKSVSLSFAKHNILETIYDGYSLQGSSVFLWNKIV